ncbi:MAG: hypothetical protein RO009_23180 [Pseudorhodoplanes sp.]|jgi:hypothetical protein|nr:hypothetical protein [Pseudorhodoplanes sp.]
MQCHSGAKPGSRSLGAAVEIRAFILRQKVAFDVAPRQRIPLSLIDRLVSRDTLVFLALCLRLPPIDLLFLARRLVFCIEIAHARVLGLCMRVNDYRFRGG